MSELREVIAKNIQDLRNDKGITQSSLAEYLNYSDKAVSKWERGESIPDITVLKQIADYFGVGVDYLLTDEHEEYIEHQKKISHAKRRNHYIITGLAFSLVWFIATFIFIELNFLGITSSIPPWIVFIYALPAAFTVLLVFNSIWGKRRINYAIISCMVWSAILGVYVTLLLATRLSNLWLLFVLGVPAQLMILLWSGLRKLK